MFQALHEHQAIRMKVIRQRRRCNIWRQLLFFILARIQFKVCVCDCFLCADCIDGAAHWVPAGLVGEPRVRLIIYSDAYFFVPCDNMCCCNAHALARYQMVTMSHEEASMKIGDVMCLCKASGFQPTAFAFEGMGIARNTNNQTTAEYLFIYFQILTTHACRLKLPRCLSSARVKRRWYLAGMLWWLAALVTR